MAGVVVGALVVLGVAAAVAQKVLFSPEATVRAYFADLADGDGTSARSRLDDTSRSELLADRVVSSKLYAAPMDVQVAEAEPEDGEEPDEDSRQIRVSYRIDGKQHTARLSLDRAEDRTLLFFRTWHIDDGTAALELPSGVPYQVNGVATGQRDPRTDQASADGDATVSFAMFPGRYDVGIAPNPLLSGDGKEVTLTLDGEVTELALSPTIKASAKNEIRRQVRAYVDECAGETTVQPENCPFDAYGGSAARNVQWSVVTYPTLTFRQATGGSVYVETGVDDAGSVTVTYEVKSYLSDRYESETSTESYGVGGPVVVKDGKVDWLSPRDFAGKDDDGD